MIGAEALLAGVSAARPCPHPRALKRGRVVVNNGSEFQALCRRCYKSLSQIAQDAEEGRLLPFPQVRSIMLKLGYTAEDADSFWRSLCGQ